MTRTRGRDLALLGLAMMIAGAGVDSALVPRAVAATSSVTVMAIGDLGSRGASTSSWPAAVQAHLDAVNARGGAIDAGHRRHPVRLLVCDSSGTRGAARCAARAVRSHVAAVLGLTAADTSGLWAPLERARIAVIGTRVNGSDELASAMSFPLASGLPATLVGMPELAATAGATRIGVIVSDYGAATDALLALVQRGIAASGASAGPVVRVPPNASNLSAFASQVVQPGVDGVVGFVAGGARGDIARALTRAGFFGTYVTQAPFGDAVLASDPADTQTALLVGQFAPRTAEVPGMVQFRSEIAASAGGATLERTDGAVNGWLAAWVFERVVGLIGRIDGPSVSKAMAHLHALDMGGITPPLTTDVPGAVFARLFNPTVTFEQSLYGVITRIGDGFVDPFTAAGR